MKHTLSLAYIAIGAALTAVCAWISVPYAVPFTLQTLAVFLAVGLFGTKRASLSVLLYLTIGALGVPVFSGFTGGAGVLLGATGGFLWGFLLAVPLAGILMGKTPSFPRRIAAMSAGMLALYLFGTLWFCFVYTKGAVSIGEGLLLCCAPYLLPDCAKLVLAAYLSHRCARLVK